MEWDNTQTNVIHKRLQLAYINENRSLSPNHDPVNSFSDFSTCACEENEQNLSLIATTS
jgi:hypothetical protein